MRKKLSTIFIDVLIVLPLLILMSCGASIVDNSLEFAGKNREALVEVLAAFESDSLKFKAAKFLIKNAVYYHSQESAVLDSLKQRMVKGKLSTDELREWKKMDLSGKSLPADIAIIDDSLLRDNINLAVDVWRTRPWATHYSFEDFCEYVLPYRISDEPLEAWRKEYLKAYSAIYDSLCHDVRDPVEAATRILTHIRLQGVATYPELPYPHLGAMFLLENKRGYCRDHCDFALYILRALGIPAATDFYRESPSYNSRHFWTAVIDTLHNVKEFNLGERPYTWESKIQRRKGKVYRQRFSPNHSAADMSVEEPFFANKFVKDVSSEYGFSDSIIVNSVNEQLYKQVYLSVFTGAGYVPIAIAKNIKGKAVFKNVESGLIYFPTVYDEFGYLIPLSYPVLTGDTVRLFSPEKSAPNNHVKLSRKYPMRKSKLYLENSVGMIVSAYNSLYEPPVYIKELIDTPSVNIISLDFKHTFPFRFVELKAPTKKRLEVAEIWATTNYGSVRPQSVLLMDSERLSESEVLSSVSDDKWETFYVSSQNGGHVTFDFGKVIKPDGLTLIPRTDDNYVHPGDTYELFFHDGRNGWKSLGSKIADSSELEFSVPGNSILWLKNHTRGSEERCFYMVNGQQIFP